MPKSKKKQNPLEKQMKVTFISPNLKALLEGAKQKKASFAYQHELLLHNQRINYKNEYDRIKQILDHTNLPDSSITRMKDRREYLHKVMQAELYPNRYSEFKFMKDKEKKKKQETAT